MTPPPVRIRSAKDLFEVLSSGSLSAQMAVLKDIQQNPRRPLSLGPYNGEDIIDLLLRLVRESQGPLRKLHTLCLMCYDNPRTSEFLVEEFERCGDAATVLHLGQRLTLNRGVDFFRPFLWSSQGAQALAAARVRSQVANLEAAERLRVAILVDRPFDPPLLDESTLGLWMTELAGAERLRTRELAEKQGVRTALFWTRWEELQEEEREWLVALTEKLDSNLARQRVDTMLERGAQSLCLARAAVRLGVDLPASYILSDNEELKALAVSVGLADHKLEECFEAETPLPVALAAVGRCETEDLLNLLQDGRWQLRAQALNGLIGIEERPLEAVRALAKADKLSTRAAAVELLLAWNDDIWLEANLIEAE